LELSFQFPIKRDGASPVVAAAAVDLVSGLAAAEVDAIADELAAGVAAGVEVAASLFFPFEITIAPSARTPTSTAKRTLPEDPCFGAADGFGATFAAVGRTAGAGVVETLTRDPPVVGTGGITTFEAALFFTADFLTAFLVVFLAAAFFTTFFAVVFLAADFFFAAVFLATVFLAAVFLAGDFFAAFFVADFLAVDFFGAAFLAALFFFTATVFLLELYNDGIWEKFNLEISAK
jgi:hypothetical protein